MDAILDFFHARNEHYSMKFKLRCANEFNLIDDEKQISTFKTKKAVVQRFFASYNGWTYFHKQSEHYNENVVVFLFTWCDRVNGECGQRSKDG